MQHREALPPASRRAVIISPNLRMASELEALLQAHLAELPVNHLRSYPSPRDLGSAMGSGSHLVFLDTVSDPEQAVQLLTEMARLGPSIQVIALLAGNDRISSYAAFAREQSIF